jgi:hypothetical protein
LLGTFLDLYLKRMPVGDKKRPFLAGWRLQAMACSIGGFIILGRHLLGMKHYVIHLPLLEKLFTLEATLVSTFFHGLDDHLWYFLKYSPALWENLRSSMLLVLLAVITLALVKMASPERRLLLSLLLLWVGACFPHVLGANWQYRYFYFPGVFAALVVVELLGILRSRYAGKAGYLLISLVVLSYLYLDLKAFQLSLASFSEACHIYDAGIRQIKERLPQLPPNSRLIMIDFPDFIFSRQDQGPPKPGHYYYVYIYRNALPAHLMLLYNNQQFNLVYLRFSASSPENPGILGVPASMGEVAGLLASPQTYVFRYLPGKTPRFIPVEDLPTEEYGP